MAVVFALLPGLPSDATSKLPNHHLATHVARARLAGP